MERENKQVAERKQSQKTFKLQGDQEQVVSEFFDRKEFEDLTQPEILIQLISHFNNTARKENEEFISIDTAREAREVSKHLKKIEDILNQVMGKAAGAVEEAYDNFDKRFEVAGIRIEELKLEKRQLEDEVSDLKKMSNQYQKLHKERAVEIEDLKLTNKNLNDQIGLYENLKADKEKLEVQITELREVELQNRLLQNDVQNLKDNLSRVEQEKAKFMEILNSKDNVKTDK